jgi:hypothetical protein
MRRSGILSLFPLILPEIQNTTSIPKSISKRKRPYPIRKRSFDLVGDDPDVTFTPPGHSYYLASIALNQNTVI